MKFGRIFSASIQGTSKTWLIGSPLTVRFSVQGSNAFSYGTATFLITNLNSDARSDIYQDIFQFGQYRQVLFSAGYSSEGDTLPLIFQGNIIQAYSYRQGPDWITEIQCLDGAFAGDNASINLTNPANYRFGDVLSRLAAAMKPTISLGTIGDVEDIVSSQQRGITLCGSPWDLMVRTTLPLSLQAFIYQEKVHILKQNEFIEQEGGVTVISGDTGMLGTPKLQANQVLVSMIFEPKLQVQQSVELQTLESRMSGTYIVQAITHRGTISGAVCEDLSTEATLYKPDVALEAA